jgi:succinate-acetate transporter protein
MSTQPGPHNQAIASTRIVLRPLGSAMPLGLFGFGAGALITACWDLHWVAKTEFKPAAITLLAFVVPLEALSSIFGFLSRDSAGATAMGIFAASWAVFGTFWLTVGPQQSAILGIFSIMLAASVCCLAIVAWRPKPLLALVLGIAAIRDIFLSAFHLGATGALEGVGWCGLILAPLAVYTGIGFLLEDANQRTIIPLFRRGRAKQSLEGSLADQLERIEGEAGVRNQL